MVANRATRCIWWSKISSHEILHSQWCKDAVDEDWPYPLDNSPGITYYIQIHGKTDRAKGPTKSEYMWLDPDPK